MFFSFVSHEFCGTSTAFPNNIKFTISPLSYSTLLSYILITWNHSGSDASLLAYPSRTNLIKDSVWGVKKCHIKSIKDIRSIIIKFKYKYVHDWDLKSNIFVEYFDESGFFGVFYFFVISYYIFVT